MQRSLRTLTNSHTINHIQEADMGAPVVHWEINASDAKKLHDFYSGLFGWQVDANNPMNYGLVNTGSKSGAQGGIGQKSEQSPATNVTFYVEVEDLSEHLMKAETLGGKVVMPVTEIPDVVTMAMFADPEGNIIGLIKSQPPPPKKRKKPAPKKPAPKKRPAKTKAKAKKARGRR
jgi:predicted enzyme related to lactoylglutathione lyase